MRVTHPARRARALTAPLMAAVLSLLILASAVLAGPVTNPLAADGDIDKVVPDYLGAVKGKAFHLIKSNISFPLPNEVLRIDPKLSSSCGIDLKLEWTLATDAPIYAPPVVYASYALNERKNIFVNTFREYIDLIDGDGSRPNGWPISFPSKRFYGSPIVFDIDGDGHNDVGLVDEDGGLFFVRVGDYGQYLSDYHIQLPPLRVRKDWMNVSKEGDEFVMLSLFDQQNTVNEGVEPNNEGKARVDPLYRPQAPSMREGGRRLQEEMLPGEEQWPTDDAMIPERHEAMYRMPAGDDAERDSADPEVADRDFSYSYGFGRVSHDDMTPFYGNRGGMVDGKEDLLVDLDPRVYASVTMVDIDKDGHMEIVFPVSYELPHRFHGELNASLYFASAVVCFDVQTQSFRWNVHLDLSTNTTGFQAKILSQPTAADMDGDGRMEILVGTVLGMIYVLDADSGYPRHHFPMQAHPIQTSIVVHDLLGGPDLEAVATDVDGNVICFNVHGEVLYDVQLPGAIYTTPTVADLHGDGAYEIIVSVFRAEVHASAVYVLAGNSGRTLHTLLLPAQGTLSAPVTLAALHSARPRAMHLILPTYEGHVYFVEILNHNVSKLGHRDVCVQSIDLGGYTYSPVLVEDVTNDGYLDLITSTLSGELSVFATSAPAHSGDVTNSWPRFRHASGYVYNNLGVQIDAHDKQRLKHMHAQHRANITVPFTISDSRCASEHNCSNDGAHKRYMVAIYTSTNTQAPIFSAVYRYPGQYNAYIQLQAPCRHVLLMTVENEHNMYAEDSAVINLASGFHVWIKYFVLTPALLFAAIVYLKISS